MQSAENSIEKSLSNNSTDSFSKNDNKENDNLFLNSDKSTNEFFTKTLNLKNKKRFDGIEFICRYNFFLNKSLFF